MVRGRTSIRVGESGRKCCSRRRNQTSVTWFWRALTCAVTLSDLCVALCASRTVRTLNGAVSGVVVTPHHRDLEAVEVFRGVPYAAPPLRFAPPQPVAAWKGVRTAGRLMPACPQRLPDISSEAEALRTSSRGRLEYLRRVLPLLANQSEDCLYLNIYTPLQASQSPVLVIFTGEQYQWSSGHHLDGAVLASYGRLVVVTLSYRLGVLGFLRVDSNHRSVANLGLLDQVAALRWVRGNIRFFGGDPGSVTLMGHGSGAACVHWLLTSPLLAHDRLFHRAVLMSGSAVSSSSLVTDPLTVTELVARHVNCSQDKHLLECLREQPLEALLSAPLQGSRFAHGVGPCEDGVVIGRDHLRNINEHTHYRRASYRFSTFRGVDSLTLRHKKVIKYDLLVGVVKSEAFTYFSEEDILFGIESDKKTRILQAFVNQTYKYHQSEILATLVNEYTSWERPIQHPSNILQETMEALGDGMVVAPMMYTADLHDGGYMYVFGHQTRAGDYPQKHGCVHGEELQYVLGAPLSEGMSIFPRNFSRSEVLLSQTVMNYWANFVSTGNPNRARDSSRRHRPALEAWLPYDKLQKRYLHLDIKHKMKDHYRAHRLSFWLNLVPQLQRGTDVPLSHHRLTSVNTIS